MCKQYMNIKFFYNIYVIELNFTGKSQKTIDNKNGFVLI